MTRESKPEPVHVLTGTIKAETGKALLMHCDTIDGNPWELGQLRGHWIPYSQINKITKPAPGCLTELDSITVKRWILQQKGIV